VGPAVGGNVPILRSHLGTMLPSQEGHGFCQVFPPLAVPGLMNHARTLVFRPGYRPGTIVAPRPGYGVMDSDQRPPSGSDCGLARPLLRPVYRAGFSPSSRPGQGGASREIGSGSSGEHGFAVYSGLQQPRPQMGMVRPSQRPPTAYVLPLPAGPSAGFAEADEVADNVGLGDEDPRHTRTTRE
jgi:hypothetical protein